MYVYLRGYFYIVMEKTHNTAYAPRLSLSASRTFRRYTPFFNATLERNTRNAMTRTQRRASAGLEPTNFLMCCICVKFKYAVVIPGTATRNHSFAVRDKPV